jgi:hypothetical protein
MYLAQTYQGFTPAHRHLKRPTLGTVITGIKSCRKQTEKC